MKNLLYSLVLLVPFGAVAAAPPPANDNFTNRTVLISSGSISILDKNASATTEALEPTITGDIVSRSVWYSWTAPFTGPVTIDTAGSSFDTLLGVFTGTALGALTSIAENDDSGVGAYTSKVSFNSIGGIPYVILVGGYNGAGGKIKLTVTTGSGTCSYTVVPTSKSFSSSSSSSTLSVTTTTGCFWTAVSNDSWISITSGSTGSGNGTVGYSVTANTAFTTRTGTLTVAGITITISQAAAPSCTYAFTPTSTNAPSSSVTNTVFMTAGSGCAWTATPNAAWITISSGSSGTGSALITYILATNTTSNLRTGTITAAGQTFTINQSGIVPCSYSISPPSGSFPTSGGSSNITVSTISSCAWTAFSPVSWVAFSTTNGTGNGTVTYTVGVNTNTLSRSTTLTVATQSYTVLQSGATCSYAILPSSLNVSASSGFSTISVAAGSGCSWTSVSSNSWISVTSGTSGVGSGSTVFTYGANLNTTSRSGFIIIDGLTFTLNQAAASCIYSITPTAAHYLDTTSSGNISVTAGTGCAWTAVSNDSFITVNSGSPGSGNGTVNYTIAANVTTSSRTGTLTVAGSTFTVTQDGTVPCSYSISPLTTSFTSTGGTTPVTVTSNTNCVWSVSSSDPSWLTFTPANGSGNGTVTCTASANTSSLTRSGTLTIAGQIFTVTQTGVACSYVISPTTVSYTSIGGEGTVVVTATSGCNWTSSSDSSWLVITNGASGTGNGSVGYSVGVNSSSTTRTGRLTIATKLLIVTQTGTACTFSISPVSAGVSDTGSGGSITLTASDSACTWTSTSQASWLSVSPSSGTGSGTINYIVSPTGLSSTRTGTLTIAGQIFTVTQFGDITGPVVTLTAPSNGSTVSNVITLTATAVDSNLVARVEFYRGSGTLLGTILTSPYNLPFQTTNLTNGSYSLYAQGYDTAGNLGTSGTNIVTVSNSVSSNTNQWAQRFGGTGSDFGNSVAVDSTGNIYLAGAFQGTIIIGGNTLTNAGARDIVLAKFDSAGTLTWVKRFGSTGDELVRCMVVDSTGNIYLGGSFTGIGNFGGASTVSAGGFDAFVAKYSSLGAFVWSKTYGSTANDVVYGIGLNLAQDGVLATGLFSGTVVFTPVITYSSYLGSEDSVMLKYLATDGTPLWAKTFVNRDLDTGFAIFSDSGDNIILAGYFGFQINLGLGTLTSAGANFLNDIYLAKFTPSVGTNIPGNATWQMRYGGVNSDTLGAVGLDSSGNIVVSGIFKSTTDMGTGTLTGTGFDNDIFLAKYSGTTGLPLWTKAILCNPSAAPRSISFDATNNVVVAGFLNGTTSFGGQSLTSVGSQDIFVAKYLGTSPATLMWARGFGGTGTDDCNGVAVDSNNYPVITGYFMGTATFNGVTLTSAGGVDMYLVRLAP
jgi:hypothetical protein